MCVFQDQCYPTLYSRCAHEEQTFCDTQYIKHVFRTGAAIKSVGSVTFEAAATTAGVSKQVTSLPLLHGPVAPAPARHFSSKPVGKKKKKTHPKRKPAPFQYTMPFASPADGYTYVVAEAFAFSRGREGRCIYICPSPTNPRSRSCALVGGTQAKAPSTSILVLFQWAGSILVKRFTPTTFFYLKKWRRRQDANLRVK